MAFTQGINTNIFNSFASPWNDTQFKSWGTNYNFSFPLSDNSNSVFGNNPFSFNANWGNPYNNMFWNPFNFNLNYHKSNSSRSKSRASLGSYSIPPEYRVKKATSSDEVVVYRDQDIGKSAVKTLFQFYGLGEKRSNDPKSLEYGNNLSDMFFGFNNQGKPWCCAGVTYVWNQLAGYDIFGSQGYNRFNQGELGDGKNTKGGVLTWAKANNVWTELQSASLENIQNTIKPGDLMICNDPKTGKTNHIAMVVGLEGGVVHTIECNLNDKVDIRSIDLKIAKQEGTVAGFVRMNECKLATAQHNA